MSNKSLSYVCRSQLPVTAEEAFAWHARPGALERLIPPWEDVVVLEPGNGIRDGSVVQLAHRMGPLKLSWTAQHHDCRPGESFRDSQLAGPFARWEHLHRFEQDHNGGGVLTDQIDYRLPGGRIGHWLGSSFVKRKLYTMFAYRHQTTQQDLTAHHKFLQQGVMNIAVTGASGLVGSALVPMLTSGGHRVTKLVRRAARHAELTWDPTADAFDARTLDGISAVVHLAGENIASKRWSSKVKQRIRDSRVHGTRLLCEGLARMHTPPKVLVCASAVGFYGDRGDEVLDESSPRGAGFLAEVAQEWEEATLPARDAGIRVVNLRFGVILTPQGGALQQILLPFKLGAGGRVGNGRQYWSWISIDDAVGAVHHALMTEGLAGPVNVVAPHPVSNQEFTRTLGRVLKRPTLLPMPGFAARVALGEMANDLLLTSTRVTPQKLIDAEYDFRQPTLESALRHLLGKSE